MIVYSQQTLGLGAVIWLHNAVVSPNKILLIKNLLFDCRYAMGFLETYPAELRALWGFNYQL
jgi:hypothetical protein